MGAMNGTDVFYNILFLFFVCAISFAFELVFFFRSYAPKDADDMEGFIAREKGKALLGVIAGAGMSAYFAVKGTNVFGPLELVAFSLGIFAGAKYKERQNKPSL
jgi:hypothetical protein